LHCSMRSTAIQIPVWINFKRDGKIFIAKYQKYLYFALIIFKSSNGSHKYRNWTNPPIFKTEWLPSTILRHILFITISLAEMQVSIWL
jgi:hypothetical protein